MGGKPTELGECNEGCGNAGGDQTLPEELGARGEAEIAAADDLDVVVGKTDGAESERGTDGDPDEWIGGIGPEDSGQKNGDDDEHSAHGGGAGFFEVRLRAVFADVLADLEFAELLDDVGADEECDEEGGKGCKNGAKREVTEDAEGMEEREQLFVEQPVEQVDSNAGIGRGFRTILQGWVNGRVGMDGG